MAKAWNAWLETMDDFDVKPAEFLDAGDDEVLVPAQFVFRRKGDAAPAKAHTGVILFRLSARKVVRLSVFVG